MKRVVQIFSCVGCISVAPAQQTNVVVPNGNANVEGNSSLSDFLNTPSFRMQMVFDASQFHFPPGASGRIDAIYFRIDGASTGPVQYGFGGLAVTASLTPVGPDGLHPVFANNIGANPVTIYSGGGSLGGQYQAGQIPQPFARNIPAITPFYYNPAQGNLLLDFAAAGNTGPGPFAGALDAQSIFGDSVSRVFALDGNSPFGTPDTAGLVTRIDFSVVPEPATWVIAVIGLCSVLLMRKR